MRKGQASGFGILILWVVVLLATFTLTVLWIVMTHPIDEIDKQMAPLVNETHQEMYDQVRSNWDRWPAYMMSSLWIGALIATFIWAQKSKYGP